MGLAGGRPISRQWKAATVARRVCQGGLYITFDITRDRLTLHLAGLCQHSVSLARDGHASVVSSSGPRGPTGFFVRELHNFRS